MNNQMKKNKYKGEKMSLRKITTLLLLVAFAFTSMPAQAASVISTGTTPSVIGDAGKASKGANRDVVPVNITVRTTAGTDSTAFSVYTNGLNAFTVLGNGALSATESTTVGKIAPIILKAPTGSQFVALSGYTDTVTASTNGNAAEVNSFVNVATISSALLPNAGTTNGDAVVLAKVTTEAGAATFFGGQSIPAGSIVIYPITNQTTNTFTTNALDITLQNIGLAVDAVNGSTLADNLQLTYVDPTNTADLVPAIANLQDGDVTTIATSTTDAEGQISVALASESDSQSNSVLADYLASGSSTVKVSPNYTTTATTNQTTLYVDTEALLIQAREKSTGVYYDTPFNTSSFPLLNAVKNGNDASALNASLSSATDFPNTANALITVVYSLVPLSGTGTTDATLTIDAASVSMNGGYLGATAQSVTNGSTAIANANLNGVALAVLTNSTNGTGALSTVDFDTLGNETDLTSIAASFAFDFATSLVAVSNDQNGSVINGTLATGIFADTTIADVLNTANSTTLTSAGGVTPFTISNGGAITGITNGGQLWVTDEVTARLTKNGGNAVFALVGSENGQALTSATLRIGPTNFGTVNYNTGATLGADGTDDSVANNAVLVANLTGSTVSIMPLVNKYDTSRDTIKVRPEATITLGSTSKSEGVKLIATVSGNNIAGSKVIEIARINAAGNINTDATVSVLPASGELDSLLAENGDDSTSLRVAIDLNGVDTSSTAIASLVANGSVLDDTIPAFYCGGTIGTSTKGPNAVPQQPFARTVLVEENTAGEFEAARGESANVVFRFTLASGLDLVKTSATAASNDVALISTDNGATGTFIAKPTIDKYMTVSETGSQAYVDVALGSAGTADTTTVKNAVGLVFGSNSLIIPSSAADRSVTVTMVDDAGTASTADDVVLDTLGTAELATGCANQFTISYCDDALSTSGDGGGRYVQSDLIANGSLLTSFSQDVGSAIRLISTDTTAITLPDICVSEANPAALFVGPAATTPNIFAQGNVLALAISDVSDTDDSTDDVGFASAGNVEASDDSLSFATPAINSSLLSTVITTGTGSDDALVSTEVRFSGVTLGKTNSNFQPSSQDLTVFTLNGANSVGQFVPVSFETRGANGTASIALASGATARSISNTYFNGDDIANTTATLDGDSYDFTNGEYLGLVFASGSPVLSNATTTIVDSASEYSLLSDDTQLSIAVDDIDAVTNGLAAYTRITVFTTTGDLEPGSTISVTANSGDSVSVPVTADGNFTAAIRGSEGDTLVITQTPTSTITGADQTVVVTANDQNLEPTLLSAVAQNFSAIGTITEQGTAPVLFELTAVGRLDGEAFAPSASDLTLGGLPVYAVPGTTNQFLGIVNFSKTTGNTVVANVEGSPSVKITGMDKAFPTFSTRSKPVLRRAFDKTGKKSGITKVIFKGNRLRNGGFGYVVSDDGSVQEVTFRNRTRNDRKYRRVVSEDAASVPENAVFGVYHVTGRGISTLDISN